MNSDTPSFDPAGPAPADSGLFGLTCGADDAALHIIPVPFEATTSYGGGTSKGPAAMLEASRQIDLFDIDTLTSYERGIYLLPEDEEIVELSQDAKDSAQRVIAAYEEGREPSDVDLDAVNAASARVNAIVEARAQASLEAGKLVGLIGGDHASPYGLIAALAKTRPGFGILHLDAHHDLRRAYEGFEHSHASIMHNVMTHLDGVARLVQVGIRDFSADEAQTVVGSNGRIRCFYDRDWKRARFEGRNFDSLAKEAVDALPEHVYLSYDIDGLDPRFGPSTGTPVPGGLDFDETVHLTRLVRESGREIIGFDLCEVAPGATEWDANVGARLLYKMCGFTLARA